MATVSPALAPVSVSVTRINGVSSLVIPSPGVPESLVAFSAIDGVPGFTRSIRTGRVASTLVVPASLT